MGLISVVPVHLGFFLHICALMVLITPTGRKCLRRKAASFSEDFQPKPLLVCGVTDGFHFVQLLHNYHQKTKLHHLHEAYGSFETQTAGSKQHLPFLTCANKILSYSSPNTRTWYEKSGPGKELKKW